MTNFWLAKENEEKWLKVVRWAQKNRIKVEDLSKNQIEEILKSSRAEILDNTSEEIL